MITTLIEKYINQENIKVVVAKKNYDEIAFNEFMNFLNYTLDYDEKYGYVENEENRETKTLEYVCGYVDEFVKEKEKGFSVEWARTFTKTKLYEENQNPAGEAYYEIFKIDEIQAAQDLQLYASINGKGNLFVKYFAYCLKIDVPSVKPSAEEQAIAYEKIYPEQINNGKSEIFANKYAELLAFEKGRTFGAFVEATEYEKAILAGYSENYAFAFAMHITEYIVNHFDDYEEAKNDILVIEKRDEIEKKLSL